MGLARNVEVRHQSEKTVGPHILQVGRDTLVGQAASMLILIRSCRSWGRQILGDLGFSEAAPDSC